MLLATFVSNAQDDISVKNFTIADTVISGKTNCQLLRFEIYSPRFASFNYATDFVFEIEGREYIDTLKIYNTDTSSVFSTLHLVQKIVPQKHRIISHKEISVPFEKCVLWVVADIKKDAKMGEPLSVKLISIEVHYKTIQPED